MEENEKPFCELCEKPAAYNIHLVNVAAKVEPDGSQQTIPKMIDGTGNSNDYFLCIKHMKEKFGENFAIRLLY